MTPTVAEGRGLLVAKVGSAVVAPDGRIDTRRFAGLAEDLGRVRAAGWRVAVVSSGAVAAGVAALGMPDTPRAIVEKQAAAAVGQPGLVAAWADALCAHGLRVAQVLLTAGDLDDRVRFLNARRTLETLLEAGVVPIINENDSVANDELRFGDNDRLAALVASLLDADRLALLSVVEGLLDESARVVPELPTRDAAMGLVRPDRSAGGTGGMGSKLDAALLAAESGVTATIASGTEPGVLAGIVSGRAIGTTARPSIGSSARKRWLATALRPKGTLVVDDGAVRALRRGASLLPAGITDVLGRFGGGAAVAIVDRQHSEIGRGLTPYTSDEVTRIMGRRTEELPAILEAVYAEEVVHREDMHVPPYDDAPPDPARSEAEDE